MEATNSIGESRGKFNRKEAKVMADYIEKFDKSVMSAIARKAGADLNWYVSCRTSLGANIAFHNEEQYRRYACKNEDLK